MSTVSTVTVRRFPAALLSNLQAAVSPPKSASTKAAGPKRYPLQQIGFQACCGARVLSNFPAGPDASTYNPTKQSYEYAKGGNIAAAKEALEQYVKETITGGTVAILTQYQEFMVPTMKELGWVQGISFTNPNTGHKCTFWMHNTNAARIKK